MSTAGGDPWIGLAAPDAAVKPGELTPPAVEHAGQLICLPGVGRAGSLSARAFLAGLETQV